MTVSSHLYQLYTSAMFAKQKLTFIINKIWYWYYHVDKNWKFVIHKSQEKQTYKKWRVLRQNCGTVAYLALYRWRSWRAARFPWYTVAAPPAARYCGAGATAGTASPPSRLPAAPIGTSPSLCCAVTCDFIDFYFWFLQPEAYKLGKTDG